MRGEPAVVVMSVADYERLTRAKPTFVEFMRRSPLVGIELELDRDVSPVREIDL